MEGTVCQNYESKIREDLVIKINCEEDELLTKGMKTSMIYIFENLRDIIEGDALLKEYPLGLKAGLKILASDTFEIMEKQFNAINVGY